MKSYWEKGGNCHLSSEKILLTVWASSSSGGETWKNFSVEANSRFADSQFDGIYLFIKWLTSWSKTIYVRTSCWSSHWLTMVLSSQLESSSCGKFCLSLRFCRGSKVEGKMSRVEGKVSRDESKMSRVQYFAWNYKIGILIRVNKKLQNWYF